MTAAEQLNPAELDVFRFLDPRDYLREFFEQEKRNRRLRSYDSLSEVLGFGRNSYSNQIINGLRPISAKAAARICDNVPLSGRERQYFIAICLYHYARAAEDRENAIAKILALRREMMTSDLDAAQAEYFSEWYHAVVRELVATEDFRPDPKWIANKIRPSLTEDDAAYSFRLLQRIGYVEFDPGTGRWLQTHCDVKTGDDVRSLALQRFHRQMVERAKESIFEVPAAEREISAVTLALTEAQFRELRARLRETRRQMLADLNAGAGEPGGGRYVFQLNTQLFALTHKEGNGKC